MTDIDFAIPQSSLSRDELLIKLQGLLQEILNLESNEAIRLEARLQEDLQIDSLGMVDVVIGVEETFGLKMRSDLNLFESVQTVGDARELIADMLGIKD
jgi:acyl carrier protein